MFSLPREVNAWPVRPLRVGQHAIEHIDAARDRLNQVFRRADTHQISRLIGGHARRDVFNDLEHHGFSSPTLRPPIA